MKLKTGWAAVLAAAALLAAGAGLSRTVGAPSADRPTRIAVVNVGRIANEMKEKQDIEARFASESQQQAAEEKQRVDKIRDLEAQRGNFRPDSPQYDDLQRQRARAVAEYKAWADTIKFERDLKLKRATVMLDDKIAAAVAEYAGRNGIDLVLTDLQASLTPSDFDVATFKEFMNVLRQRRIIYASKGTDVSDEIISLLDGKYRSEGAAGAVGAAGGGAGGAAGGAPGPVAGPTDARPAANTQASQPTNNTGTPRRGNNR